MAIAVVCNCTSDSFITYIKNNFVVVVFSLDFFFNDGCVYAWDVNTGKQKVWVGGIVIVHKVI